MRGRRSTLGIAIPCALAVCACATVAQDAPPQQPEGIPAEGPAAEAASQMQEHFLELWSVTRDDDLPAEEKRDRARALVSSRLDERALARAALGFLAERFSPAEREAFADAYARYVVSRLVARVARHPEHPVEVQGASWNEERRRVRMQARGAAEVAGVPGVRRLAPRERIRLGLTLREVGGEWKVVALSMNEVDVSTNFRDQFRSVLQRSEPAALVAELEERNERDAGENPFD